MATPSAGAVPPPPQSRGRTRTDDRISTAETIARFVAEGVSGSGVRGLEGPAKTLLGIISHFKKVRDNSAACEEVVAQIGALTDTLKSAAETVRARTSAQALPAVLVEAQLGSSVELAGRIAQLQRDLDSVSSSAAALRKQEGLKRFALASRNADLLNSMCESLRRAREDFMLSGQLAIEVALSEVAAVVKTNDTRHQAAELGMAMEKLPYADAGYRASVHARHGRLLAGTRQALLKDLDDWTAAETDGQREHPFYVLSGGAGTGKSTIAYEVASRAEKAARLGASFFFMRGSALLNSTEVFFPTLARQLIANIPALQPNALAAIQEHLKHGTRQNLDSQANDLFSGLLSMLPPDHPPVVIVVDAVDECTESAQDLVPRMLFLMMDALSRVACRVRVFVTSRPEVHIEDALQSVAFTSAQKFRLHEIPRPVIDADIRLYCGSALAELPDASRTALLLSYPDASDDLTDLAAGLFIYATTAIEFLKQYRTAIVQGMDRLASISRGKPMTALQRLDELYILVLQTAFPPGILAEKRLSIQALLGHVAALQDHISPSTIAKLTGASLYNDVLPVLDRLGAVLSFEAGNPDALMRPLHASFGEFLTDPMRCTDAEFRVDPVQHHFALTEYCLAMIMRPGVLRRNICRLPDANVPRHAVNDLSARLDKYLSVSVQYSCAHWVAHLALSGGHRGITRRLSEFCHNHSLEWIEAVAFLDVLDRMVHWLPILHRLLNTADFPEDVSRLLYDIWRVMLEFSPVLKTCPQQLYLSAVPLLPTSSQLSRSGGVDSPALTCYLGTVQNWAAGHDIQPSGQQEICAGGMSCAVVAPHGRWIAISGSENGTVHLCNAETGSILISVHELGDENIHHLYVSSNGLRLVSTSDHRVCVLSTRSGAITHQLDWPFSEGLGFWSASFVREGRAVLLHGLATELDSRLDIWDLASNTISELCILGDEYSDYSLEGVTVSGTGNWAIAIVQQDDDQEQTIGIFIDLVSESVAYTLPCTNITVCFVPGTDTAVVPLAGGLCLYNVQSGTVERRIEAETNHFQIVVSPDSATVVGVRVSGDGSPQHMIDVWSPAGYQLIPAGGHFDHVLFSPDGGTILAFSASGDFWRVIDLDRVPSSSLTDSEPQLPSSGGTHSSVAISRDGSWIAAATAGALRVYDTSGTAITSLSLPGLGQTGRAIGLAFSHERRLIIVADIRVMYVCDLAQGAVRAHYTAPDDLMFDLADDVRLRRFGLGPVDENAALFEFRLVATTPDDSAVVALLGVRGAHSAALFAARWDLGLSNADQIPRVGVVTSDLSRPPWGGIALEHARDGYIDANGDLHFCVDDYDGRVACYTVPRAGWDRADRGADAGIVESPVTGRPFYLAADGWIARAETGRRVCWLPASRRPGVGYFASRMAAHGHVLATISDAGLVTVLRISDQA